MAHFGCKILVSCDIRMRKNRAFTWPETHLRDQGFVTSPVFFCMYSAAHRKNYDDDDDDDDDNNNNKTAGSFVLLHETIWNFNWVWVLQRHFCNTSTTTTPCNHDIDYHKVESCINILYIVLDLLFPYIAKLSQSAKALHDYDLINTSSLKKSWKFKILL